VIHADGEEESGDLYHLSDDYSRHSRGKRTRTG
jgi:hypothetical protein